MSYRVLHSKRQRPLPPPDVLGLARNVMRENHPHAHFNSLGWRWDTTPEGQPVRAQALVLALNEPSAHPAQRYCPHKPQGTWPRPHKKRGLMNRALALSAAHASSAKKLARLHREGFAAAVPDPVLAITHGHVRRARAFQMALA